jgi:hypothetical protein
MADIINTLKPSGKYMYHRVLKTTSFRITVSFGAADPAYSVVADVSPPPPPKVCDALQSVRLAL